MGDVTDARGGAMLRDLDPESPGTLSIVLPVECPFLPKTVRAWTPADARITLARAYAIAGRVLDEGRKAIPYASVRLRGERRLSVLAADVEGRFRAEVLPAGTYELRATWAGGTEGEAVAWTTVNAGTEDVELRVKRGVVLKVHVSGWPDSRRGTLTVTSIRDPATGRSARIGDGGDAWIEGLDPVDTYVVWCGGPSLADAHYAYATGVQVREDPLEVTLVEGETIRGRMILPKIAGSFATDVTATGLGVLRRAMVLGDGTFRVQGLPPGRWEIQARTVHRWAGTEQAIYATNTTAATGERDLVLEPEPSEEPAGG